MDPGCWALEDMITQHENEELEKPFAESEIKEAVMSMEKKYSPWT
jgi:hypothetical protein